MSETTAIAEAIAARFRVQRKQAMIAAVLFESRGEFVAFDTLARRAGTASQTALKVHVSWLREGGLVIETEKGFGYRLAPTTVAECVGAVVSHAGTLLARAAEASRIAESASLFRHDGSAGG